MPVRTERKAKKSYTLSLETVAFLETARRKRRANSVSAVLEEILQDARRQEKLASVERAVNEYYSSLSASEIEEQRLWGEFALQQISSQEER